MTAPHPHANPPHANSPLHIPVMLERVAALLRAAPGETYADATAGLGGHAATIARALVAPGSDSGGGGGSGGGVGGVVLNDLDPANLARAEARVAAAAPGVRVVPVRGNFAALPHAAPFGRDGMRASMLLADLGFASTQVDEPARGFSFKHDGPLDMRYDGGGTGVGVGGEGVGVGGVGVGGVTAADLVNGAPEAELARIIDEFGEERFARTIARKIVHARATGPIRTTTQLANLVRAVVSSPPGIDPATRTFQALRIAVNDEMGSLDAFLAAILDDARRSTRGHATRWLAPGARVVIISFHSLEDRRVKAAFLRGRKDGTLVPVHTPLDDARGARGAWGATAGVGWGELGLDAIAEPTEEEIRANPRARSAKVRAARLALPT